MNRNALFTLIILISLCLPFTYGGCGGGGGDNSNFNPAPTVVGSGNIVQEIRSVTGATGVELSGVANLTIEQGAPEELILETDDNLMAHILTDVRGGILEIRKDPPVSLRPSRSQRTGIEAHLTLSSIDSITLSGVGGITVPDLTTTQLELTLSGLGDIEISNLDATTSDVLISGFGGISVAGQVDDQIITLLTFNAPGDYDAENLSSATVDVEIAGSESATVRVSPTLNANITGSGSVFYHGSPAVTITGTGTGSVDQLSP
jgi:hypothetical protein